MNIIKKAYGYILNTTFVLGWLCFYGYLIMMLFYSIVPGTLDHGGKPSDLNFYIFLLWYIGLSLSYSFLCVRYFKDFFVKKVNLKIKSIIILKLTGLVLLIFATILCAKLLSGALGISHFETAFWYYG